MTKNELLPPDRGAKKRAADTEAGELNTKKKKDDSAAPSLAGRGWKCHQAEPPAHNECQVEQ